MVLHFSGNLMGFYMVYLGCRRIFLTHKGKLNPLSSLSKKFTRHSDPCYTHFCLLRKWHITVWLSFMTWSAPLTPYAWLPLPHWPDLAYLLQIYPDPELEQQILALPIRCIHSEEGCRWTGQMKQLQVRSFDILSRVPFIFFPSIIFYFFISAALPISSWYLLPSCLPSPLVVFWQRPGGRPNMWVCMCVWIWWHISCLSLFLPQGHFSTCAFNVIPCPNRCSVKLTRRDLPDHLQHDCPKRKVKCEFCGSEFTGEAYEVNTSCKPVYISFFFSCWNSAEAWR